MYNSILVPIDVSETDLTRQVIPYVQAHSVLNTAKVHFLTVVPTLPYYSSFRSGIFSRNAKIKKDIPARCIIETG